MKNWLKSQFGSQDRKYTVDELIVLQRWDDAEAELLRKLKRSPSDAHSLVKLAEVYSQSHRATKAVESYCAAAGVYAEDGFVDKGMALLAKAARIAPHDQGVRAKMHKLQRAKANERTRELVVHALSGAGNRLAGAAGKLELDKIWNRLQDSDLVYNLPPEQLQRLFSAMEIFRVRENDTLAERGNTHQPEIYLLAGAEVEAIVEGQGNQEISLRRFAAGDVLGDSALFEHQPWPATYRVRRAGVLLRLTREGLERVITGNEDPRRLLDALRGQRHDRTVAHALQQLSPV